VSAIEFKLPELGEGVERGTVARLLVAVGDAVAAEQAVAEVEIDKATVELPCPHAGTVAELRVAEGDEVTVGQVLLTITPGAAPAAPPAPAAAQAPAAPAEAAAPAPAARAGNGVRPRAATAVAAPAGRPSPAGPAVRRLARLLGVDLDRVAGSGERGRITPEDVHAFVEGLARGGGPAPAAPLPDFSRWGPARAARLSTVRKRTAEAMARSWAVVPHVTHHDLVDVTDLEAGRKAFRKERPEVKVTMTVLVAKACAVALREFPDLNSSLDLARGEQVLKDYVHLGIAVDTEYGLLVPVLRDVDRKSVVALSDELTDLAGRTRDKKVAPDELQGGTFTISNLGGIGGVGFTPIVNWPQVAILGLSRSRWEYRPGPEGPEERLMMPVSLSYDHRIIDGAQAARFVRRVGDLLSAPTRLLFHA